MMCDTAVRAFHGMILYDSVEYSMIHDAMVRYGMIKYDIGCHRMIQYDV